MHLIGLFYLPNYISAVIFTSVTDLNNSNINLENECIKFLLFANYLQLYSNTMNNKKTG